MAEQDPFMTHYEASLDEIVGRNLHEYTTQLYEIFDHTSTQFDVLAARHESWEYVPVRKADHFAENQDPVESKFDQGYLHLWRTIRWKGDELLLGMLSPADMTQFPGQANLMDRQGLAASLGTTLRRMAEAEAVEHGFDLTREQIQKRIQPFTSDEELTQEEMANPFEIEDPYRSALIPFSHTDITPLEEDGLEEFRDWALNIDDQHTRSFLAKYATVLVANKSQDPPQNPYDALRVNLICAATFADYPAISIEGMTGSIEDSTALIKDPGRHIMTAIAYAIEHLGMISDPSQRAFGALMIEKALNYCHFEQLQKTMAIFGGTMGGMQPEDFMAQVIGNDGSSFYKS